MSLEQYKDASRKELWDILQIQVERIAELEEDNKALIAEGDELDKRWISRDKRIAELETLRARAEILIHELHEQVYDSPYLDNKVGLYEALKETK